MELLLLLEAPQVETVTLLQEDKVSTNVQTVEQLGLDSTKVVTLKLVDNDVKVEEGSKTVAETGGLVVKVNKVETTSLRLLKVPKDKTLLETNLTPTGGNKRFRFLPTWCTFSLSFSIPFR